MPIRTLLLDNENQADHCSERSATPIKMTRKLSEIRELAPQGVELISLNDHELTMSPYEQSLIKRLTSSFHFVRQTISLNVNLIDKLNNSMQAFDSRNELISHMANFIAEPIERVVTFAKLIPDFERLNLEERSALIESAAIEMFICSASSLYVKNNNNNTNENTIMSGGDIALYMDRLRGIWGDEMFTRTIKLLVSLNDLLMSDETALVLLLTFILFSRVNNESQVPNVKQIIETREKYFYLLKKHLQHDESIVERLLAILNELKEVKEMHTTFLATNSDHARLQALPAALILKRRK